MRYALSVLAFALASGVAHAQPSPATTGFDFCASIGLFSADRSETTGPGSSR